MQDTDQKNIHPVEAMLRRRGFDVKLKNPTEYLFFPHGLEKHHEDEVYELLKKYSFRIFIRDVIKNKSSFRIDDLIKYSTRESVETYMEFLLSRGIIEAIGQGLFRLKAEAVFSFGDTLEWFTANVFEREFSSPALWGVRLAEASAGGDYDVIASVEGELVYVEAKSSPPKNVEDAEIAAFLRRARTLKPAIAIFIEDTTLRMKDKIVPIFEGALKEDGLKVERLIEETFGVGGRLYITNSAPDLIGNIGYCLRDWLMREKFL